MLFQEERDGKLAGVQHGSAQQFHRKDSSKNEKLTTQSPSVALFSALIFDDGTLRVRAQMARGEDCGGESL